MNGSTVSGSTASSRLSNGSSRVKRRKATNPSTRLSSMSGCSDITSSSWAMNVSNFRSSAAATKAFLSANRR